jgi:uncharacterized protein
MSVQIQSFRVVARLLTIAALGLSLLTLSKPADAQGRPLDAPRAAGVVGERWDGFAEVRGAGASAEVIALVATTNDQRRQVYQKRATAESTSVAEVGKIYAKQILSAAPAGTWSLSQGGTWSQK